jgi:hypothetical protein
MKQLLKENIVLVAGILLPLLLAGVFWVSKTMSLAGIEPPGTQIVFWANYADNPENPWNVEVREGKLHVLYSGSKEKQNWGSPQIYIYNPAENVSRPVVLPRLDRDDLAQTRDIVPDGLKDITLSTEQTSPDGYTFSRMDDVYNGYNRGVVTEIFGGGANRYSFFLKKGNYNRPVPMSGYNSQFVGWIVQ